VIRRRCPPLSLTDHLLAIPWSRVVHAAHINRSFGSQHQLSMVFAILTRNGQQAGIWGIQVSHFLFVGSHFSSSQVSGAALIDHSLATQRARVVQAAHIKTAPYGFAAPVVNGVCLIHTRNSQQGNTNFFPSVSSLAKVLKKKPLLRFLQYFPPLNPAVHFLSPYLSIQISRRACQARPQCDSSYPPRFVPPPFLLPQQRVLRASQQ
jgi:hypothetical protein